MSNHMEIESTTIPYCMTMKIQSRKAVQHLKFFTYFCECSVQHAFHLHKRVSKTVYIVGPPHSMLVNMEGHRKQELKPNFGITPILCLRPKLNQFCIYFPPSFIFVFFSNPFLFTSEDVRAMSKG